MSVKQSTDPLQSDLIICWGQLAEFAGQYLARGRLVFVGGRLSCRTWDGRDGQKRRAVEIVANEIVLLDHRPDTGQREAEPAASHGQEQGSDDDLPF